VRVLLVEDETALADVLERNLRVRGHDVMPVTTAESALTQIEEQRPDALIIDVNLPDLTGWDILRRTSVADRDEMRVIIISAAPISPKRVEEFRPAAALQKPFPIDALIRALGQRSVAVAPAAGERGEP
jgi:DNA-binding response OmpR family regulator